MTPTVATQPPATHAPLIARYRAAYLAAHGHEPALLDVDEAAGTFAMRRFDLTDTFDAGTIERMAAALEWRLANPRGGQGR